MELKREIISKKARWIERMKRVLECITFSVGAFLTGWLFSYSSPLSPGEDFSWLAVVPVVMTLYAGIFFGILSAVLMVGCSAIYGLGVLSSWVFPLEWISGCAIACAVAVSFRYVALKKLNRLESIIEYQNVRIHEFSQDYQLLKQSHEAFENKKCDVDNSSSLYGSMMGIRHNLLSCTGERPALQQCGHEVMQLLRQHGHVQVGAFLSVINGEVDVKSPAIRLGNMPDLRKSDSLIMHAVEDRKSISVNSEHSKSGGGKSLKSNLLACVPFVDSHGVVHGVLAIRQMPLSYLSHRHLNTLMVLCGYIADSLHIASVIPSTEVSCDSGEGKNNQKYEFHSHLKRCLQDITRFRLDASIVAISIKNAVLAPALIDNLMSHKKILEVLFAVKDSYREHQTVLILMPLTGQQEVKRYIDAFPDFVLRQQQVSMVAAQAAVDSFTISQPGQIHALSMFLQKHNYPLSHAINQAKPERPRRDNVDHTEKETLKVT